MVCRRRHRGVFGADGEVDQVAGYFLTVPVPGVVGDEEHREGRRPLTGLVVATQELLVQFGGPLLGVLDETSVVHIESYDLV